MVNKVSEPNIRQKQDARPGREGKSIQESTFLSEHFSPREAEEAKQQKRISSNENFNQYQSHLKFPRYQMQTYLYRWLREMLSKTQPSIPSISTFRSFSVISSMSDQRQGFRFRFPWSAAPAAPRPSAPQPSRPAAQTQASSQTPAQPTTTPTQASAQRPPFRPAGIAPTQAPPQAPPPPPRAEGSSRAASQTRLAMASSAPSPARKTNETRAASSPSRTAPQSRAASTPSSPSPSRAAPQVQPQSQAAPKPQSPSRLASESGGQTSLQPSSPPTAIEEQPTPQEMSVPPPPSNKLQSETQESNQPPSSATQPEKSKPEGSEPLSHDPPQLHSEFMSETVASSGNQISKETKSPHDEVAPQPAEKALVSAKEALKEPAAPQKLENDQVSIDHPHILAESKTIPEETEGEEEVEESVKEENNDEQADEQPIRKTITQLLSTAASGSGTQTKELRTVTFQAEQKDQEKEETSDRVNTVASSGFNRKQVNVGNSRLPRVRHTQTDQSHQEANMSNGERAPLHKEVRNNISEFVQKLAPGHMKEPINEKPVSIVTLAGENKGASMQLGSESAKKEESVHIYRGYKMQPDESPETTTDGEESFKRRPSRDLTKEDPAMKAYVNNNVQSINNSIVFDCCVTERNPGVKLALSHSQPQPVKSNTPAEAPQTSKAEFRVTPAEKLTYQPTIRRRCLRGLLMESSDSEPDNPSKPRRHGCRYSCGEKGKNKDIGIL